jgi:hypothetical protein
MPSDIFGTFRVQKCPEKWDTVISGAIRRYGIGRPTFEEVSGAVVVTFRAPVRPGAEEGHRVGTRSALSRHQVQILERAKSPKPLKDLLQLCGRTDRTKFRDQVLRPLLEAGLLELTIPDKPTSSLQKYRTTAAGERLLKERR